MNGYTVTYIYGQTAYLTQVAAASPQAAYVTIARSLPALAYIQSVQPKR